MRNRPVEYRHPLPLLPHEADDPNLADSGETRPRAPWNAPRHAHHLSWLSNRQSGSDSLTNYDIPPQDAAIFHASSNPVALYQPPGKGIYQHKNLTEDNLALGQTSENPSKMYIERRSRMDQIYGLKSVRSPRVNINTPSSYSPTVNGTQLQTSSVAFISGSSAPPLPLSTVSKQSGVTPNPSNTPPVASSPGSFASASSASSHSSTAFAASTTASAVPLNPHPLRSLPFSSNSPRASARHYKLPTQIDVQNALSMQNKPSSESAPVSAVSLKPPAKFNDPLDLKDMMNLPDPFDNHSAPPSPTRSFNLPKFFNRTSRGSSRVPSRGNSRSSSPNLASRIGLRISSGFSSRLSSRLGSGLSNRSSVGLNTLGDTYRQAVADPIGLDDDWPAFSPRRPPKEEVVDQLRHLGPVTTSRTDIDAQSRVAPQNLQSITMRAFDEEEVKGFTTRGVYYYQADGGATDEEGNYNQVIGEQIGFRYRVEGLLGKGSFGKVFKCRDFKSGRMVAVKVNSRKSELRGQVKIEAGLLRALLVDHKGDPELHHFLRFVEYFEFRGHFCIATEMLGPNLYEVLKKNNQQGLSEPTVRYITRQLCEGLEFLGTQGIIHCDMKPENILISDIDLCQVKIVDFGSSCYEGKRLYTYIQSRFYRAPEILLGMPYNVNIDMWSLGAIVPELLIGKPLFRSVDESDQVVLMCQVLGIPDPATMWKCTRAGVFFDASGFPLQLQNSKGEVRGVPGSTPLRSIMRGFSLDAIDFVEKTLSWSPQARLGANKAVYHPFVLGQ